MLFMSFHKSVFHLFCDVFLIYYCGLLINKEQLFCVFLSGENNK